jgi:competence protein ComEA
MPEKKHRYLQFSRKERWGIYLLLGAVILVFAAPSWLQLLFPRKKSNANPADFGRLPVMVKDDSAAKKQYASKRTFHKKFHTEDDPQRENTTASLFYFDPNTLGAEGWEKLGIRSKTAQTIVNYRSKGGRFNTPEDLDKIFGLSNRDVERLMPYVQIAETVRETKTARSNYTPDYKYTDKYPPKKPDMTLNINTADTATWKLLPGIGAGYARRIVHFREKLGGFHHLLQVAETKGLPDSVFQKIKDRLICPSFALETININTASAEILATHPYISKNLANNIVQYRNQHGPYHSVDDLQKLVLVSNEIYLKINAYLSVKIKN